HIAFKVTEEYTIKNHSKGSLSMFKNHSWLVLEEGEYFANQKKLEFNPAFELFLIPGGEDTQEMREKYGLRNVSKETEEGQLEKGIRESQLEKSGKNVTIPITMRWKKRQVKEE